MSFLILIFLLFLLIWAPQLWVRYILAKYSSQLSGMPGSGGELAVHLLERFELSHVQLEMTEKGKDHYDPVANCVRLGPDNFAGKSLTAVAVAAHEVGHAIQFNHNEPVSLLRRRYLPKAHQLQKIGVILLMGLPMITALIRIPHVVGLSAFIGLMTMLSSVFIYLAILPEEWDASFNKALPILQEGYVPKEYIPAIRQILRACALTYVAAALANTLSIWRWLALLKTIK